MKKKFISILSSLMVVITMISPVTITAQAATVGQMKDKVISVAKAEVGYTGTGSYSKYGEWYGYQGAWCTTFVLWCFNKAGNSLDVKLYGKVVPNGGNCNSMISWYQNKDRYHKRSSGYTPKKGDLVFFDWSGNGSAQHVGIVKSTSGSTVYTIEGNCSGKVKERKYTTSGSKPYNNISAILGYGSPNWSSVADGSKSEEKTTKKKTTAKKKTTTKKSAVKKKSSSKKEKKKTTTKKSDKEKTTKEKAEKSTTTEKSTTKKDAVAKDMKIHAATQQLEVGDSVQLDYTIEPTNAPAVVSFFCDEENVTISKGGMITANAEGTATVVVCANDEIYRQLDFTVTAQSSEVTHHSSNSGYVTVEDNTTQKPPVKKQSSEQKLKAMGINVTQLKENRDLYIIPVAIISVAGTAAILIALIRQIHSAVKRKKNRTEN